MNRLYCKIGCLLTVIASLTACFEDKGNYDYDDVNPVTIDFNLEDAPFVVMGDPIDIVPILTNDRGEKQNPDNYTYRWRIDDMTREEWNKAEFHWVTDEMIPTQASLILEMTDKKTGITYFQNVPCKVSSLYDRPGWVILSEKNNVSQLAYVTLVFDYETDENYTLVKEARVYQDVYRAVNQSDMGSGPITLHEHFTRDSKTTGQHLVLQKSGGVDVNGQSLKKEITLAEIFSDGAIPSGSIIQDAMFMEYVDLLEDQNGQIFSRIKSTNKLFHSNYFLPTPISYQGEVLKNCELVQCPYVDQQFALICDRGHSRLLAILDGGTAPYGQNQLKDAAKIIPLPPTPVDVADIPEGFVPLDKLTGYTIEYIGYFHTKDWGIQGYSMILKDAAGNYYSQEFKIEKTTDNVLRLYGCTFDLIRGLTGTPSLFYKLPATSEANNLLIAVGNELLIFDNDNPGDAVYSYLKFSAPIKWLNAENWDATMTGVGLADGSFSIINSLKAKNVPENRKILYTSPSDINLGDIKMVKYRIRQYYNW